MIRWAGTKQFISDKCNNDIKKMDKAYEHDNVRIYKYIETKNVSNEKIIAKAFEHMENKNLLIKYSCYAILRLLKNIDNQSGGNNKGVVDKKQGGGITCVI